MRNLERFDATHSSELFRVGWGEVDCLPAAFCSCPITTLILLCWWRLCDPGWQHCNCQDRHHRRRGQSNLGHLGHQHWHQSWALQVGGGVWRLAMMVPVTRALGPEPWAGGSAVVGGGDCTCTCVVGCRAPGRVCGGGGGGGSCSFCSWSRIKCSWRYRWYSCVSLVGKLTYANPEVYVFLHSCF